MWSEYSTFQIAFINLIICDEKVCWWYINNQTAGTCLRMSINIYKTGCFDWIATLKINFRSFILLYYFLFEKACVGLLHGYIV